ncbi:MAG: BatA domain-containing protein [Planctomycetes bacterium]|nr:BatA domain-containing protein [Planctomycetota bacterium]
MNLAHLSPAATLLGLAALLVGLFLLQRLRTRHRERVVPTTMFWRQAAEESRARVLVERFRHLLAFLLVALVAALVWLALAGLELERGAPALERIYLLDGSAQTAARGRFGELLARLASHLEKEGAEPVIFCGARPRTLLERHEDPRLLRLRARGLAPEACAPAIERTVRELLPTFKDGRPRELVLVGAAQPPAEFLRLLPEGVTLTALPCGSAAERPAIGALGASPALSLEHARADVLIEVQGPRDGASLLVDLEGAPLAPVLAGRDDGCERYLIENLEAAGGLLTAALAGEDGAVLDRASLVLPRRALIRVSVAQELRPRLLPALVHDPAVLLVEDGADVACVLRGAGTGPAAATLDFVERRAQEAAFLVSGAEERAALEEALGAIDLGAIERVPDASSAPAAHEEITAAFAQGTGGRRVSLWLDLLLADYDFTQTAAFPVFLGAALRWLAGADPHLPFVAAGAPVRTGSERWRDEPGREFFAAGGLFTPPRAGLYFAPDGARLACVLPPSDAAPKEAAGAADEEELPPGDARPHLPTWLGLIAFLLLLAEWRLWRSGRIP